MEKKNLIFAGMMRALLVVAILIGSIQFALVAFAEDAPGVVIENFDMEGAGTSIWHWNAESELSTEAAHSGSQSLKINPTSGHGVGGVDANAVSQNKTYVYSFWAKIAEGSPFNRVCVGVQENWATIKQIYISPEMTINGDFVQYTFTYSVPDGITSSRYCFFGESDSAGGSLYVDDFKIIQSIPYISSSNIVDGEYDVPLDRSMEIDFDMTMNAQTFDTITVNGSKDLIHSITASNDDKKATIVFNTLSEFTGYAVDFSGVENTYGNSVSNAVISFVTAESGAGEVIINKTMESEPTYKSGTLNETQSWPYVHWGSGTDGGPSMMVYFGYDANRGCGWTEDELSKYPGKTFEVSFKASTWNGGVPLELRTKRLGTIARVNSEVDGNLKKFDFVYTVPEIIPEGEDITYFWSGDAAIDFIDDLVVKTAKDTKLLPISTPADNAQNVALDSSIDLMFNNNIDASTATTENIQINGGAVPITNISASGNIIKISADFDFAQTYTVTTANIKDVAGRDAANVTKTFTTVPKYSIAALDIYKDYTENPVKLTDASLQSGDITAVLGSFENNSDEEKNIVFVEALFDGMKMVDVKLAKTTVAAKAGLEEPLTVSLNVPDLATGDYKVKAFVWEDLVNINQITDKLEISE